MKLIKYSQDAHGIVTLTLDDPDHSANTMSTPFKAEFHEVISRLEREKDSISGVIITSAKKTFFAGGNLNELLAVRPGQADGFFRNSLEMKAAHRRLERLGRPVVAAVNGAALGGGWEICLICHARFALDDEKITLGLPEVTLGLLPGAGGVVRMTRLLGLRTALPYLLEGRLFSPAEGLRAGLLDGLAPDRDAMLVMARDWITAHPNAAQPWDQEGYAVPGGKPRRLANPVSSQPQTSSPRAPPSRPRTALSASSRRIRRLRSAPRAARTPSSGCRRKPRARSRLATLVQAMRNTNRTAPSRAQRVPLASFTPSSRSGESRAE